MADEADIANDYAEAAREAAIAKHRTIKHRHKGSCYNCGERLHEGAFCPGGECEYDFLRIEVNRRVV